METKVCTKCQVSKPLSSFSKNSSKKYGLSYECRECHRILRRNYYLKNKEKEKENALKHKRRHLDWYKEFKKTLFCTLCGENHMSCLHFHHLSPVEKEYGIAYLLHNGYSKKRILEEMAKCVVVCANCHAKIHWNERNPNEV